MTEEGNVVNLIRILALAVDRHDDFDAVGLAAFLIFLTEARRHMHDAGAVAVGHKAAAIQDAEGMRVGGEVGEKRVVGQADEVRSLDGIAR